MRSKLPLVVKKYIEENALFTKEDMVVVALSGGADSVALLLILKHLKYKISAIHVNHNLRGQESARDEAFCKALCERLDIPLEITSVNVKAKGKSIELAARELRYKAFSKFPLVATAHNANDNAETVIYNLARGAGLKGLCGIPNKILKGQTLYVRPLLEIQRQQIDKYLSDNNIDYVTDSSNLENEYTRNRIRHFVIPSINESINRDFVNAVTKTVSGLWADSDYLDTKAKEEYEALIVYDGETKKLKCSSLLNLHEAILNRVLMLFLGENTTSKNISALKALIRNECPSAKIKLSDNIEAKREYDSLILGKVSTDHSFLPRQLIIGENTLSDGSLLTLIKENNFDKINKKFTNNLIDLDKIEGVLLARPRKVGDSLKLFSGTKTIKKLMIEKKIPQGQRAKLPVVECDGQIVCAINCGVDKKYLANKDSKNILVIEYNESKK